MTQTMRPEGSAIGRLRAQARAWRHPWSVRAAWKGATWTATVKAGYVNGHAPIVSTSLPEQKASGLDFGTNPLTKQPYFSSFVFGQAKAAIASGQFVDIPLYLAPAIPLQNWRELGAGGSGTEGVPDFFLARGVVSYGADVTAAARRLVARDLIVHQPRMALSATITRGIGFDGTSIFSQVLTTVPPPVGDRLKVFAGFWQDPVASNVKDQIDPLSGQYEEPAWDELKVATVYLLSPPGIGRNALPGPDWQPFAKHGLFWNLAWMPARMQLTPDVTGTFNPLGGLGALGGGLLAPITNVFAAEANDLQQQALDQILARSQAGTFFTQTGGGHTTALPAEEIVPIGGTNKAARLAQTATAKAAQLAAAQRAAAAGLDPDFPYTAIGFDAARFSLS